MLSYRTVYRVLAGLVIFSFLFITPHGMANTIQAQTIDDPAVSAPAILNLPDAEPPAPPNAPNPLVPGVVGGPQSLDAYDPTQPMPLALEEQFRMQEQFQPKSGIEPLPETLPQALEPDRNPEINPELLSVPVPEPIDSSLPEDIRINPDAAITEPTLPDGMNIQGSLADSDGAAQANVIIRATAEPGDFYTETLTDAQGRFALLNLPTGDYSLLTRSAYGFLPLQDSASLQVDAREALAPLPHALTLLEEVTLGLEQPSRLPSQPPAIKGEAMPSEMTQGTGVITGTVTKAGGIPLFSALVSVYTPENYWVAETYTDENGLYSISGLDSGNYIVYFWCDGYCDPTFLQYEYYNNKSSYDSADLVPVTDGATASGIDAVLDPPTSISGNVTSSVGGFPIQGIEVYIENIAQTMYYSTYTDSDGFYILPYIEPDTYIIHFNPYSGFSPEYYNNKLTRETADPVTVAMNQAVLNIDAQVDPWQLIHGRVTSEVGGTPVQTTVTAYPVFGGYYYNTQTNPDGTYALYGMEPGSYRIQFSPQPECDEFGCQPSRYLMEYYNGKSDFAQADVLTVTSDSVHTEVNATLQQGGAISGNVTTSDGVTPLEGVNIYLYTEGGSSFWAAQTDLNGNYQTNTIEPGTYKVGFDTGSCSTPCNEYLNEYFDNALNLGTAAPVVVLAQTTVSGIDAALALGGSISGRVIDAATSNPLEGLTVYVQDDPVYRLGITDANGEYRVPGLPERSYTVYFSTFAPYVPEYYNHKYNYYAADKVPVTAPNEVTGINAALSTGGGISGVVIDETSGVFLANVYVSAASDAYNAYTYTNTSGDYTFPNLPEGTYKVAFYPNDGIHLGEYFDNKPNSTEADPVVVTPSNLISGINAALSTGGEISGTVTSLTGGIPLEQVGVILMNADKWWVGSQKTDSQGNYHFTGLDSGTYYIQFDTDYDCSSGCMNSNYISEFYNGKATLSEANAILVTVGQVTSGIDAALSMGGSISGNMTGETGSCAPFYSYANLYNSENTYLRNTSPNDLGNFSFGGLQTGVYKIHFTCPGFISEWYNDKYTFTEGLPISVTAGVDTSGINVVLAVAGGVSGVVTSESTGLGLGSVYVTANNGSYSTGTWVNGVGEYSFSSLPAGSYKVYFSPGDEVHLGEYYNNKSSEAQADLVIVTPPAVTSGIDAALSVGGSLSGRVTAEDTGLPLENIAVLIQNDSFYKYGYTDADGHYTIGGIPGGTYHVAFYTWNNSAYTPEFYNNKRTWSEANLITITPPAALTGIDAALTRGASISGTVISDEDGLPLVDVYVLIQTLNGDGWAAYTDSEGRYSFNSLPPDTYRLKFIPSRSGDPRTQNYVQEYYKDAVYETDATLITLAAGQNAVNYNASLAIGARITGQVTAAVGGLPVPNVRVEAYLVENGSRDYLGDTYTDETGSYALSGLSGGDYYVYFRPDRNTDFIAESYNNKVYWQEGDLVTVPERTEVNNINASLESGRHITGTITSASTGYPIPNWFTISIYDEDGRWREYAYNEDGTFLSPALPPGTYRLYFNPRNYTYNGAAAWLNEYYNNRPTLLTGIPITVGSDSNTAAGNVALDLAGQISGRVTAQATGLGIGNLRVEYRLLDYRYYYYLNSNEVFSNNDGTYAISYLEPGEYEVCFSPANDLVKECISGIDVTVGGHVENVDAALEIGGRISGRITADGSLVPLADVFVDIYHLDGSYAGGAVTSLTGDYISSALAPGEYLLQISPSTSGASQAYMAEFYNNQTSYYAAVPVGVTAGQNTSGIDASLALGGKITGRVTEAVTGDPLPDHPLRAYKMSPQGDIYGYYYANADLDGNYAFEGLPAGSYKVLFNLSDQLNLMEEYYNNQRTVETADLIYVADGMTVSGIDAALEKGAQITGRVINAGTGLPISGAYVFTVTPQGNHAYGVSDNEGFYSINGLSTGEYLVSVNRYTYANTMVGGFENPTHVSVTAGEVTQGIDVALVRGAVIAGWVTGADNGERQWAYVQAYNSGGYQVYTSFAGYPKGLYELILAPEQDYRISFSPSYYDQPYATTFYANKSSLAEADPIHLASGTVLFPVNVTMLLGGQISGRVTGEFDLPLADVLVIAYDATDEIANGALTDAEGNFLISGLAAGSYRLVFDSTYSGTLNEYLSEIYNDKTSLAQADPVVVVSGETTSGINAQLTKSVLPIAGFGIGSQTVGESAGSVSVSLTLDKPGAELITIPFTIAGTASGGGVDHTLANGTFQFAVGETLNTINFNIVDDAIHETDETIVLTLGSPINAALGLATAHTVTIQDNDELPLVSFAAASQTVSEAVGTVSVALNLNASYPETVSAPYSVGGYAAGGGIDHTLQNGVLAFNPGQTSKTITFNVVNDSIDEMDESIVITLGQPVNAQLGAIHLHTVTVQDNDEPVVVLPAPTVTQVTPSQGWSHVPTEIVLYGTNFSSGAVVTLKLDLQSSALSTTFISETQLLALVPGGLTEGLYSVEVSNPDGKKGSLSGAYKVMPQLTDDLFANSYDIWTEPGTVYAGKSTVVGLNIQRQGGLSALPTVKVDFYLGDPAAGGTKLASPLASNLSPGGWVSTTGFSWTAPAAGSYTLVALIDPENSVNETNETNNMITRQITVLSEPVPQADLTPPTISSFVVNQGKPNSASSTITYTTSAVDNLGGSGLNKTMIIEYAFFEGINQWIQVKSSDWLPYQENIDQTYQLVETAGARYLQIWAADNAGNVSTKPRTAFINYIPANDTLVKGQSRYYVFNLTQGQEFNAVLTPTQGDPDLYVWAPDFYARDAWMSLASEGPDTVVFSSPLAGMYVVQIYSFTNSGFQFSTGGVPISRLSSLTFTDALDLSKEPVAEPGLEPGNVPSEQRAVPDAPQGEPEPIEYAVFLPMIKR